MLPSEGSGAAIPLATGPDALLARQDGQALRQWPAMLLAAAVFATLSVLAAVTSPGFLEADACTHYLYARFGLREHHFLVNVWGRPFCTILYALPALLAERLGVRITSMLLGLAIGLISWRIAKNQGYRWPGLALIFVLGQPILFLHSFSELTELPFAFLVALGFWAYQSRAWTLMVLVVSLMPTARPEGFGFILMAAVALVLHRRWWLLPLLILPLMIWSLAGWYLFGQAQPWYLKWWRWLYEQWPYATESLYQRGYLVHFLVTLPAVVSPLAFPAVLLGTWLSLGGSSPSAPGGMMARIRQGLFGADHRIRCQWLIALIPFGILAVHSLLYWRGKMASNGELRYMLAAAPMWGLLAARGWEWVFVRLNWKSPLGWAGIAVLIPAFFNGIYKVVPLQLTDSWIRARQVSEWYRTANPWKEGYTRLAGTDPGLSYFLDISPSDWARAAEYWRPTIEGDHLGIMLVWDPIFGLFNADPRRSMRAEEIRGHGWIPVKIFSSTQHDPSQEGAVSRLARKVQRHDVGDWIVFLSPYDAQGRPTPRELEVPLPANQ